MLSTYWVPTTGNQGYVQLIGRFDYSHWPVASAHPGNVDHNVGWHPDLH